MSIRAEKGSGEPAGVGAGRPSRLFALVAALGFLFALAAVLSAAGLRDGSRAWAAADTEEWPLAGFDEPSGIVYHPVRKTLFVVGDEGDIGEVSLEGKLLNIRNIGGDLEGVTCDPATGLVYAIREGHEILFEVDPGSLKLLRRFTIDRSYAGNANYLERGSDGIEGITFVPDADDPDGGRFYAVNQFDPPVLLELEVPLASSKERFERATIRSARPVKSPPLSDVLWHEQTGAFLIVSALWRSVYVTDREGNRLRSVRIPGFMQEGLAGLPDGSFVIVQDTGGLIKWTPSDNPFAGESEARASTKERKDD